MLELISTFLDCTYEFLNSIRIPGFNISFMSVLFGAFGAVISIALLKMFFGLGDSSFSSGSSIRGGNNKRIKISSERRGDER